MYVVDKEEQKLSVLLRKELRALFPEGGIDEENLYDEVQNHFPGLSKEVVRTLAHYAGWYQIPYPLKDIVILDEAVFAEEYDVFEETDVVTGYFQAPVSNTEKNTYAPVWTEDFLVTFTDKCIDKEFGDQFAKEFNSIFLEYYGYPYLPGTVYREDLSENQNYRRYQVPMSCTPDDIMKSYEEGKNRLFKIASQGMNDQKYRLLEIEFTPKGDTLLTVKQCDEKVVRLSELLQKQKETQKVLELKK